jgi:glycosyltransferase involved in cell wall biosynthesis
MTHVHSHIVIVFPAYNAQHTLQQTIADLPPVWDELVLCDDGSEDETINLSKSLGLTTLMHPVNKGYGGNQKTLYDHVLQGPATHVIMVHPDNQYDTSCLPQMIEKIDAGAALVLGDRMAHAKQDGMPLWRRLGNKLLTMLENRAFGQQLNEYHSGLRAYDASLLRRMPYHEFSDDFVFDSEVIAWTIQQRYTISQVPTRCYYTRDHISSVNFKRSVRYGFATLHTIKKFYAHKDTKKIS